MAFHEQIFVKDNKTLEKKRQALNEFIWLKNNKDIKKEKFMVDKGLEGEKQIAYQLSKTNIGMYIFHDIKLQYEDLSAQIDYIVVTSKACYFIEVKNYSGNIRIDESGNFIRNYKYNGKKIKKGMDSPIRQVEAQLDVFTKIALSNEEKMKEILKGTRFSNYFKTLVVFTDEETILETDKAPEDIKSRVIRYDGLIRKIEQINSEQEVALDQDKIEEFVSFISSLDKTTDEDYRDYYIDKFHLQISTYNLREATKEVRYGSRTERYKNKVSKKNNKKTIIIIIIVWLILALFYAAKNSNAEIKNKALTNTQQKAISIIKSAYTNSKQNGFEIIHTNVCNEVRNIFNVNKFNCDRLPLEVNFVNDNEITIYKDHGCYRIELSSDGKKIVSAKRDNIKCDGYAIGYIEWDKDNEYYKKIGGYDKIREMAIYSYNNDAFVHDYFDYNHIEERGGNPTYSTTYMMEVDMYFGALTGKGYSVRASSTNRKETNKMCESLYYIMK